MTRITTSVLMASVIAVSSLLTACAPLLIGGAIATTAMVASDRRTVGQQVSDKEINLKLATDMNVNFGETARISSSAYDGVVLLTGDAFSEKIKSEAASIAANTTQVKSVINRLHVGPLASFSQITADIWLASKVKTALFTAKDVPYGAIIVTVERDNVYLQGLVTEAEAKRTAAATAGVGGVKEVYTLFDVMTPEQAQAFESAARSPGGLPPSNPTPTGIPGAAVGSDAPPPGQPSVAPVVAPTTPMARPL